MTSDDTSKIDAILKQWEELKSTLPDVENLIREGTEILKENNVPTSDGAGDNREGEDGVDS